MDSIMINGIIIGFGNMGQTHYERYSNLGVNIVAVIDNDKSKSDLARSKGLKSYQELSQFPKIEEFNFIDICSPTFFHFDHLMKSIKYKKPIFIDLNK